MNRPCKSSSDPQDLSYAVHRRAERLRRWLPTAQTMEQTRSFVSRGHYLRENPCICVLHRRSVASGRSVGRRHRRVSAATANTSHHAGDCGAAGQCGGSRSATGLTNPFTMAPIWGLSAHVGAYVVQQKVTTTPSPAMARCLLEAGDVLGSSPAGGFSHRRRRAGAVSLRLCVPGLGRAHQTRTAAAPAAC